MTKRSAGSTEPIEGNVTLCIRLQQYSLVGRWRWDMQSTAVYCSDVMEFPAAFEGTKGIVHPDDLPKVCSALQLLADGALATLDFRLITTYGDVKTIHGQHVSLEDPAKPDEAPAAKAPWEEKLESYALRHEAEALHQRQAMADTAEKLYRIGAFALNKSTGEAWYSDGVYRIYGLAPESLNAHQNTFLPFLHPDDRIPFLDAFEAAFDAEVPVHLEYRIQFADGETRTVRLVSYWAHNSKGHPIFTGILRDLSEEVALADQASQAEEKALLHQQVLKFSEQSWNTGYWFLDLVTRKITYSDNYFRLYGLKPQQIPTPNVFLSLVHPEDRARVKALMEGVYNEHLLPETEFRIIRPDGRQRQLKQSGKLLTSGTNLVVIGVVQDITVKKGLENKIHELNEKAVLQDALQKLSEEVTETSFITWYPEGQVAWSEGFYKLLGYKPGSIEPLPRLVHRQIHLEDLKAFKDAETLVANGQQHEALRFRITNKSGERQLQISFHRTDTGQREVTIGVVKDVSREESIQKKIADTTLYADVLSATTSDLVFLTDAENMVLSWNRAAEEKTGIKAADALYCNLFDLYPMLNGEDYLGRLYAARNGVEVRELRARNTYLRKAHHYYLTPIKTETGEVSRILHVVQDVSKELDLQQQLTERLQFIERLVDATVDRIVVLDRHMNYVYWNKKAEEYYAISRQRVIGHNILEVFPGFRNDPNYEAFRKVLKGETVYLPPLATHESTDYFETYLIPILDEQEEVSAILWIVHDLSNELQLQMVQRNAQQQLEEEHRRLKEAQAIGQVGSFEWKVGSEVSHWSDELYRINGLEPQSEEITLARIDQFIHPDDLAELQALKEQSMTQPGRYRLIHRIVHPDGEVHWVNHEWESVAGADGSVDRVTGVVQDITERKKAEQEVLRLKDEVARKATDKYLELFNSIDEGFYQAEVIFDAAGNPQDILFLEENPAAMRIMGQSFVGKTLKQINPGYETHWFDLGAHVALTGESKRIELYSAPNEKWFNSYVTKVGSGNSPQIAILFHDLTERKKAEEALHKLNDRLVDVLENTTDAFYGLDADFRFTYVNKRAAQLWQRSPVSLVGKHYWTEFPQAVGSESYQKHYETLEKGVPLHYQTVSPLVGKWIDVNIYPTTDGGLSVFFRDITERKKEEERQAYLLQLSDALRSLADPVAIEETVTRSAMDYFAVDRCYFGTIDDDNFIIRCDAFRGDLPSVAESYPLRSFAIFKQAVDKGRPLVVDDARTSGILDEALRDLCIQLQMISFIHIPVIKNGKPAGNFCLVQSSPRVWMESEVALVTETAERTWAAMERARAERALQESEQKFRNLIEASSQLIWEANALGEVETDSPSCRAYTGQRFEEWVGSGWLNAVHPDDRTYAERQWREAVDARQNIDVEFRLKHAASGTYRWVHVKAAPVLDAQGRILRWTAMNIDIQLRKEAEAQLKDFAFILEQQVTERTKALQESAAFVAEITQTTPDRITIHDALTAEILYTNHPDFWKELYHNNEIYQQAEEKRAIGLVHPDEQEKLKAFLQQRNALTDGTVEEVEIRMKGDKWVRIRSKVFKRDENGAALQLISFTTDITEQKKAELELQKSLAILQHTEELAQIGSWEYAISTGRFTWSEGMYNLFGLPMGTAVHPEIYLDFAAEEDRSVAKRIVKNLKKHHQSFEEMLQIKKAGAQRQLRIKGSVVNDEKGQPQRIVGVDLDITESTEAEKRVAESRHWLEQTALASPDAITIYDLQQKQPIYLNQCLANWLGTTNEELVQMGIDGRLQMVHADDRLRLLHFNEKLKAAGDNQLLTLEYRIHRKDGSLIWVHNRSKVFQRNARGEVTHVLSVLQDITESKAAERVLKTLNVSLEKKNQELESANEEITSFAFVASHDLKEPLRKIHTFSNLLLTTEGGLSDNGRQTLEKLNSSVKRLNLLINDILTLTKVHVDSEKLVPVDLNILLDKLQKEMQERWSHAVIDATPLPVILGAENHLFYLLKNLISNGIKFQEKGKVPRINIQSSKEGAYLKITIRDNGIGIDPEYHKKIFEIFRRLHSRTEYEGTGMGLAICKKIMEKHGGKITVESEPGQGTSFTCWFPLALLSTT